MRLVRVPPKRLAILRITSFAIFLAVILAACGSKEPTAGSLEAQAAPASKTGPKLVYADSGSVDIAASGKTVERNGRGDANSVQCQLNFTVANKGASVIETLLVEYHVLNRTTAETIKQGQQMVIAKKIGIGETTSAARGATVDDFRCSDLTLSFPFQPGYQCRTTTSATCAAFTYTGADGITIEREEPNDSGDS